MASRDLYDMTVRLQLMIEAAKVGFHERHSSAFDDLESKVAGLLYAIKYESLAEMPKRELDALISKVRKLQLAAYKIYTADMIDDLRALADVLADIVGKVYELEGDSTRALWKEIIQEPIGATGDYVPALLSSSVAHSTIELEKTVRKAYANSLTGKQAGDAVVKSMATIRAQSNAVTNTNIQHITAMISQNFAANKHGKYRWVSVLDSSTTEICESRSDRIYEYGKGPLPPAHVNCRSIIIPYVEGENTRNETMFSFLKRSSNAIQNIALGSRVGAMLRSDKLAASDVRKLANPPALALKDFKKSIRLILEG